MKKQLITGMLGIAVMLASCSQQEDLANEARMQTVTISLNTDNGIQARAEVPISRYVMEVYEMNGATATPANLFADATTHHSQQTTGNFTLVLDRTKTYRCLFWADNDVDGVYNVGDLKAVTLNDGKEAIEASYFAAKDITASEVAHTITLKHAVARINLLEKDKIKAGSSLSMTYTPNTAFSVLTGEVTAGTETTVDVTLDENGVTGSEENPVKIGGPYYILAPDKESSVQNFKFELTESTKTTSKEVTNVPVRANYTTNIRGQFSDYTDKTFNVSLTNTWEEGTTYDLIDMADFTTQQQYLDYFEKQGKSGTLKIIGDMTAENLKTIKDALSSSEFSYVIDLSGAKITDPQLPDGMFRDAEGIKGVILPEGITAAGDNVFNGASNLKSVKFPTSLESVGDNLFSGCSKLESVNLDETKVTGIPGGTFFSCGALERIALGNVGIIQINTFIGCSKLKELDLSKCEQAPSIWSDSFNMVDKTNLKVYVKTEELRTEFLSEWSAVDSGFTEANFVVKQ